MPTLHLKQQKSVSYKKYINIALLIMKCYLHNVK